MQKELERVLLYAFGPESAELARRVRGLGYAALVENEPRAAAARVALQGEPVGAALLPASFTLPHRGGELDQLQRAAGAAGIRFVAVGARPSSEAQRWLREKRVRLGVWEPFDDRELRFVVNRALFDPKESFYDAASPPDVRHDLRVPTALGARIVLGGRERSALVYSLSVGGCFLETQRPALVGATLELFLALPLGEFRVSGRVVLTNVPGNLERSNLPRGMGVEFLRLGLDAREAIQHFVRERARAYEL